MTFDFQFGLRAQKGKAALIDSPLFLFRFFRSSGSALFVINIDWSPVWQIWNKQTTTKRNFYSHIEGRKEKFPFLFFSLEQRSAERT